MICVKKTYLFILLCLSNTAGAKVLLIVPVYNRPDFIEIQYKTFKKFLQDEYELIIFSDARLADMHQQIETICNKYDITCVRVPQEIHDKPYLPRSKTGWFSNYHDPAVRNANVIQYALDIMGLYHDDILAIVDSDVFLFL